VGGVNRDQAATVARYHAEGWQPWEIAERTGLTAAQVQAEIARQGGKQRPAHQTPPPPAAPEASVDRMRQRLLSVQQLLQLPRPEPLIGEVLVAGSFAVLYGKYATGKSFLALDWALCVAAKLPWQGQEVRGGRVLYVAAEGSGGLGPRVAAWLQHTGLEDVGDLEVFPEPLNLTCEREVEALVTLTSQEQHRLVVIDTLNRSLVGGDENSSTDIGQAIDAAGRVQKASGGAVVFIHHPGKDGQTIRGHSSLEGAVDTMLELRADGDLLTLKCEKQKDGMVFEPIHLRREVVTLSDGVTTSCVLVSQSRVRQLADTTASEDTLLEELRDTFLTTGASKGELREVTALTRPTFYRALSALLRKGLVTNVGSEKQPRYKPAQP
jgi:hypothetical protein